MARPVVTEFMSVDGVIEDPGRSGGKADRRLGVQVRPRRRRDKFKVDEAGFADKMNSMRLGEGKRLSGDIGEPSSLELVEAKQMGEVITLTYTPAPR